MISDFLRLLLVLRFRFDETSVFQFHSVLSLHVTFHYIIFQYPFLLFFITKEFGFGWYLSFRFYQTPTYFNGSKSAQITPMTVQSILLVIRVLLIQCLSFLKDLPLVGMHKGPEDLRTTQSLTSPTLAQGQQMFYATDSDLYKLIFFEHKRFLKIYHQKNLEISSNSKYFLLVRSNSV